MNCLAVICAVTLVAALPVGTVRNSRGYRIAVIEPGGPGLATELLVRRLGETSELRPLDPSLVTSAVRGAGYDGSVNLTRDETRRLGAVASADGLVFVETYYRETSPPEAPGVEAYLAMFLADARTGELASFAGIVASGDAKATALDSALRKTPERLAAWPRFLDRAAVRRQTAPVSRAAPELDLVTRETPPDARPPRFFRNPSPTLTADAERARVTATVDVLVTFAADGSFGAIEVDRWAGFGLDDEVVRAVRSSAFVPAAIRGRAVESRALLRYTFRVREASRAQNCEPRREFSGTAKHAASSPQAL